VRLTIGEFLLHRLQQMGVAHVLGVPGDYNLQFIEQFKQVDGIEFVGTCNELNAAYAADGYARLNGAGAVLTSYGVGELSALNGVAGACVESLPLVCITGAPPLHTMEQRWLLHHTLADGNFDNMMTCYRQFTAAQTRLTPANAVHEIDRVLRTALLEKRPVYLQLPSNISWLTVDVPDEVFHSAGTATHFATLPASEPEQLRRAVQHVAALLAAAQRPALLLDISARRLGLQATLQTLVDKLQLPYAALRTGRCILNETAPLSLGIYGGAYCAPPTRAAIEEADCLLATSPRFVEINSGLFSQQLPQAATVNIGPFSVSVAGHVYEGVMAQEFLTQLAAAMPARTPAVAMQTPVAAQRSTMVASGGEDNEAEAALTQDFLWPQLAGFLRTGDVIVAETGTPGAGLGGLTMPDDVHFLSSDTWGSIGYTLPALLGTTLAAPQRRHLLFIGDGSFQMTAQELSTLLRLRLKPLIFLLNNRGYTIERFILGMDDDYNDVANWQYSALPKVFGPDADVFVAEVKTRREWRQTLHALQTCNTAAFVELHLDPYDAPEQLKKFCQLAADFDYGERGPHRNPAR